MSRSDCEKDHAIEVGICAFAPLNCQECFERCYEKATDELMQCYQNVNERYYDGNSGGAVAAGEAYEGSSYPDALDCNGGSSSLEVRGYGQYGYKVHGSYYSGMRDNPSDWADNFTKRDTSINIGTHNSKNKVTISNTTTMKGLVKIAVKSGFVPSGTYSVLYGGKIVPPFVPIGAFPGAETFVLVSGSRKWSLPAPKETKGNAFGTRPRGHLF